MKYNYITIMALSIITGLGVQSCSQEETVSATSNDVEAIIIRVNDNGVYSNDLLSRATTTNFVTTFDDGDRIGLFAVRDGAVIDAVNNVAVTCNSAEDSGWESVPYVEELEGATYYAYYPYSDDVKSLFDASKSDPFENVVSNWSIGTDLSGDNYTKYDLMTASASPEPSGRSFNLNFNFEHRMALALVQLPYANIRYQFTNSGMSDYVISASYSNESFKLNDNAIVPYTDTENHAYRILLTPSVAAKISGTFVNADDVERSYETSLSAPAKSKYYMVKVDAGFLGEATIEHTLKAGDRYYADGTLESVDVSVPTVDKCIGIVVYVGNPMPSVLYPTEYTEARDVLLREHPNCTHGLVLGLGESSGPFSTSADYYLYDWYQATFKSASYASNIGGTTSTIASGEDAAGGTRILGYNNTRLIQEYSKEGYPYYDTRALATLSSYAEANPAPAMTTDWYIPSVYELRILALIENSGSLNLLNDHLTKVGGTPFSVTRYWSSTESNATNQWCLQTATSGDNMTVAYQRTAKNHSMTFYYRFSFAF